MSEKQLTTDVAIQYLESIIYEDFAPYTQKCLLKVIEVAREAEPVVHGEWVRPTMINGVNFDIPHCSVCETVPCDEGKYCPNCGAKMINI